MVEADEDVTAVFFLMIRRPAGSTLFPCATRFRSDAAPPPAGHRSGRGTAAGARPALRLEQHGRVPDPSRTAAALAARAGDRKSTRLNSSHANISYAVFCLKKTDHLHPRPPLPPAP